jgi:putative oxidoreductase
MERVNDTFLLVGRLLIAALFLTAGIPKALQGYGGGFAKYLGALGVPYPEIVGLVAVAIEVLVPIALILGVFPRISALLLIAFVVVATGLAHRFWEFPAGQELVRQWTAQQSSFLKNIAIIGGLLFYYVSGPGAWALAGRRAGSSMGVPARA